jgi:hypothetical protein
MKMNKILVLGTTLIILLSISSCDSADINNIKESYKSDQNSMLEKDRNEEVKIVESDVFDFTPLNYSLDYSIKEAKDYYELNKLSIPEEIDGLKTAVFDIYDRDNVIIILYDESIIPEIKEVGLYDVVNNDYNMFIEVDQEMTFQIVAMNLKYIILEVSYDDYKTSTLHYYDIEQEKMVEFFERSFDPEKNVVYYPNYNDILLIDNIVYFDDCDINEDGNIFSSLYSYNIADNSINLISQDKQNPMLYSGEIYAFSKNKLGEYRNIETINAPVKSIELTDQLIDVSANNDTIFSIVNSETNAQEMYTIFSIKDIINQDTLLSTKSAIGSLDSNENFVV